MKETFPKAILLVLITLIGAGLLFWLAAETPSSRDEWVGAGIGFFVWLILVLSAFGSQVVRFVRIVLSKP